MNGTWRHLTWAAAAACALTAIGCAPSQWHYRSAFLRSQMREILTLPDKRIDLAPVVHRTIDGEGYRIESVTYASEPGSRVTALLYVPAEPSGRRAPIRKRPAVIVACGHGGSKSCLYAQYAGQLYAKLGFVCLVPDTIGEEERDDNGRMGARGHDLAKLGDGIPTFVHTQLKRMILGKIVWDLIRGVDYLESRPEVDPARIGIVGYSLGGATAGSVAILDSRIKAAVICGWVFRARYGQVSKYCTRMPYAEFARIMRFDEMTALLAPHAATLFMVGDQDDVIDSDEGGAAVVRDLRANVIGARRILAQARLAGDIEAVIEPDAGHRPYFLSRRGVEWLQDRLSGNLPRPAVPQAGIRFGQWVDAQHQQIEPLYNTEARERGLLCVDVGAVWRNPHDLASFPDRLPSPEYTMSGWIKSTLTANAGQ